MYIDKTELIYKLTHSDKIYFLNRPRRFGKIGVNFDSATRTIGDWKVV